MVATGGVFDVVTVSVALLLVTEPEALETLTEYIPASLVVTLEIVNTELVAPLIMLPFLLH